MKVTKLPSGNYRCRVYVGKDASGKKMWKSITGPDKKRVVLEASKFSVERDASAPVVDTASFKHAADTFLGSHESVLSPSTYRAYKCFLRIYESKLPLFCEKSIYTISTADLQMVVDFFVRQGLKPKTIRNYYGFVSAVLVNAGINVRPPRLPQKERPEIYIPDEATVRKLLQIVEGTELEIPVMLAAFGPLRRGEICALSMDDIKDGVCHVHHDLAQNADGEWVMKAPKTYSSDRYIELPDFVADVIKRNGSITDLTPDQISWKFADVLEQNGLPHFRFHSLRHFCISYLHSIGIPDVYIMQRSGHSTATVLRNVYTHTLQDRSKTETEKILGKFSSFRE